MLLSPLVADWIGRISIFLLFVVVCLEFALTRAARHVVLSALTRPLEHIRWKPIEHLVAYIHWDSRHKS